MSVSAVALSFRCELLERGGTFLLLRQQFPDLLGAAMDEGVLQIVGRFEKQGRGVPQALGEAALRLEKAWAWACRA